MQGIERAYARINLNHLLYNIRNIADSLEDETSILAILKADAYGHGSVVIARELEKINKVHGYAVATIEEALEIRRSGARKPILILSYCFPSGFADVVAEDIRITIFDYESACLLNEEAGKQGKKAFIHIAADTGMGRIGVAPDDKGVDFIKSVSALSNLEIEGIYTHFARADELDKTNVNLQYERFTDFITKLEENEIYVKYKHCSNSAAIIDLPKAHMNLVRAGIILYGLWPSDEVDKNRIELKPVMELKSSVCFVKDVPPGFPISYGGTYVTEKETKVATITIGYADGYPRCLSGKGQVIIRGKRANIIGRVCMDQFMADVTNIEGVARGDEVTLIGEDGKEFISMDEFSETSNRINYESVCDIGKRVPRVYEKDGIILAED